MPTGLPPGLGINSSSGVISGTPTTAGVYTFTVQAIDVNGLVARSAQSITIYQVGVTPAAPDGQQGTAYTHAYTGTGGVGPYTFAITAGGLPTGLSMDGSGNITGTPTTPGTYTYTVRATDTNAGTGDLPESVDILGDLANKYWQVVHAGNPGSDQTNIWVSEDLSTWQGPYTRSTGFTGNDGTAGHNMAWSQNTMSIFGSYTAVTTGTQQISDMSSTGGVTAPRQSLSIANIHLPSIAGGYLFIVKDNGGSQYAVSTDGGVNWSYYTTPANSDGVRRAKTVFKLGSRWFMQLVNATSAPYHNMAYSDEAVPQNWTTFRMTTATTSDTFCRIACNGVAAVTIQNSGTNSGHVWRSTNGIDWTRIGKSYSNTYTGDRGIIAAETGFLAGVNASGVNCMISSTDNGVTWTDCGTGSGITSPSFKLAVGDRIIVRNVSDDETGYYTDDFGATWAAITRPHTLTGGDWKIQYGYAAVNGTYTNISS